MATYSRQTSSTTDIADGLTIQASDINAELTEIYTALGTSGIGTVQLANSSVTTAKIANEAVTMAKIASSAIKDEDNMTSNSSSFICTQQSIKAYVDTQDGANFSPATYSGGETTTLGNGLILKFGQESVAADTVDEVTYGTAFPTGFVTAVVSYKSISTAPMDPCKCQPKSGSETSILQIANGHTATMTICWIAVGY